MGITEIYYFRDSHKRIKQIFNVKLIDNLVLNEGLMYHKSMDLIMSLSHAEDRPM